MGGQGSSGGGGYNNEAWNSWLYSGMLSTMLGSNNGVGMAGQASAASLARANMQQLGLAGGKVMGLAANPKLPIPTAPSPIHRSIERESEPVPYSSHYNTVNNGHYPQDPRIVAYQNAGGYDGTSYSHGRHKRGQEEQEEQEEEEEEEW